MIRVKQSETFYCKAPLELTKILNELVAKHDEIEVKHLTNTGNYIMISVIIYKLQEAEVVTKFKSIPISTEDEGE